MPLPETPQQTTGEAWAHLCTTLAEMKPVSALAPAGTTWETDDAYRTEIMSLVQAYFLFFCSDAAKPDWIPFLGSAIRTAGTNPDTLYQIALIDPKGTYRIAGTKGTVIFADILAMPGIIGVAEVPGPSVSVLDLGTVAPNADGHIEVIFSTERPAGYDGHWWRLDPRVDHIWLRQYSYDWENEIDYRLSIERLDNVSLPAPILADQIHAIGAFIERYKALWHHHIAKFAEKALFNRLELQALPDISGEVSQSYFQGLFDIPEGMALILEVEVPHPCRYWSVHLTDEHYTTIEWIHRQSSLNGFQARLDADGCFRAVICAEDPGVANWLDTGGRRRGTIMGRWNHAAENPLPKLALVSLDALAAHLPIGTQRTTAEERRAALRARARGAQLRRRW